MRTIRALLAAVVLLVVSACSGDPAPTPAAQSPVAAAPKVAKVFVPPATGLVTPTQLQRYKDASVALQQLQDKWSAKVGTAQGQQKILVLEGFDSARTMVCEKLGLAGYTEYRWIDSAMRLPANQPAAASAGIVFPPAAP